MLYYRIPDYDDAYANGPNIADGSSWPGRWAAPSAEFREHLVSEGRARLDLAYAEGPRNRLDLFVPAGAPRGLVVFVHGGFWQRLDKSFWAHLAAGPLAHGYAVAMPQYTLCPDIRVSGITAEIGRAIDHAASLVAGPIHLAGHSAGGHLVSRMVSATSPLATATRARIGNTVSISGLHDLRPMLKTAMNDVLKLDEAEARAESPALLEPGEKTRLFCWAGGNERAEFLRQNSILASLWRGLGATTGHYEEPDRHHFNILDGLALPDHPLTRTLLADPVA